MIGIGEPAHYGSYQDELLNERGMLEGEIDGEFAAMGTADEDSSIHLALAQQRGEILYFGIPSCWGGRATVAAPVVADGVEFLAEDGPHHIPYRGVRDAVMNENDGNGACPALFVVELRPFHFNK